MSEKTITDALSPEYKAKADNENEFLFSEHVKLF